MNKDGWINERSWSATVYLALNASETICCIPSVMFEVRYTSVNRAAGYRRMLVQARAEHLRIDIQDPNHNSLGVEYAGLL
jgi:hypothetical protein